MSTEVADESSSTLSGPLFVDHRFVECDEVSREICKLKAEQESKQKRTFTKWINAQLRTHWSRMFVVDLYIDIRTGVMLCYLVETVTDRKLAVNAGRRLKRIHYISNFNMVLSVLRQYGLELVNNNPVDLANGNPPIVLGLIWQIILHFEIKRTVLWLLRNDTSGVIHNAGELSVEKWLLQWLRNEIAGKYGREVDDLDHTWKDGILFNALIHHTDSTLVDMTAIRRNSDGRRNLEHAFTVAEQRLNIPRLLDLDDVDCAQPDKRSIMTYLVQFLRKTADRKTQNSPRAADENAGAVGGINETSAGGESEEDNHFAETGPLSGPLCREDINHQLRIIQMWLETTNAFLARQTATATALNEQIDAIVNYQTQMPQIEHVLLFVEHAPKALRTDEATTELTATKQQYYNVTKPAIPAKLKALNLIKPQLITLDEKWTKLTKCLKHVADGIEAEEDINVIKDDLKEIGEELAIAQVLTDSICQQQNDQHVNVPIIMEKTRQLCSQFDILKVQLSGQVVEEEMASFQVAEQAVTELIASFEQEISADSNACTTDMRARAPSFALISTYPVLFDIGKVNSETIGKIEKMKQAVAYISDKNKTSAEERISTKERKWSEVLEQLNAFNDRIKQQMKRDEQMASYRSQYDTCRNELELRFDRFEQLFAKQKHLRKSQIFLQVTDAHADLKQQEKMFDELEGMKQLLQRQSQLLANLAPLMSKAELAEAKQEMVGFELRLDLQYEEIREHIGKRMSELSLINETGDWIRSVRDGRGTVVVGGARKELLKTLISEAEERLARLAHSEPHETVRLLASQAQQGLQTVHNDLKQQLALVEYNEWYLAGIDRQLKQLQEWTETTLTVCRATPASPRSGIHQLKHIELLITQLPSEHRKFVTLKTGCPPERTAAVRRLDGAFNDIRTKLINAKQDISRYIESCDYLAHTAQWLNATEHKLASLELVAEMDVSVAFEVLNDVRKDVDDRKSAMAAIIEQQPAIEHPAAIIRQRMSEISDDRVAQCESTLSRKLDMFQQLEQLAEFYQSARKSESALGIVPVNQAMVARVENSSLARDIKNTLSNVGELQTEVDSLQAKFFQTECDRIRERFYYLIGQLQQILTRCDRREGYFDTLSNVSDLTSVSNTNDETTKLLLLQEHSTSSSAIRSALGSEQKILPSGESFVECPTELPQTCPPEEATQRILESKQETMNIFSSTVHIQLSSQEHLQPYKLTPLKNDSHDDSVHTLEMQENSEFHNLPPKQRFSPVSELREKKDAEAAVTNGVSVSLSDEEKQNGTITQINEGTNKNLPHSANYMIRPASSEERFPPTHGSSEKNISGASALSKLNKDKKKNKKKARVNGSKDSIQLQTSAVPCASAVQRSSPATEVTQKHLADNGAAARELQGNCIENRSSAGRDATVSCKQPLPTTSDMVITNETKTSAAVEEEPLEGEQGRRVTCESTAAKRPSRESHKQASMAAKSNTAERNDEGTPEDGTFAQATESAEESPPPPNVLITTLCTEFTTVVMTIHEHVENFTQRMKKVNITQVELQAGINDLLEGQERVERIRRSIPSVLDGDELRRLVDRELAEIGRHLDTFHNFIDELNQRERMVNEQLDQCSNRIAQMSDEKERLEFAAQTMTDHDAENWKRLVINIEKAQEELRNIRPRVADLAANCRNAHTASLIATLQADVEKQSNEYEILESQVQAQLTAAKRYEEVADNMSTLHKTLTAATSLLTDESAAPADFAATLQKLLKSSGELEKVERTYKDIPISSNYDELRAKLAWDLSNQRECLNKLIGSLQDRCQLYAAYHQQSNFANKELNDIEMLISGDSQAKKRKKKKRKDTSNKENVEQTEQALARLTAHEEALKQLRRLANGLLPNKAPLAGVEEIESKNAALSRTYEERLAQLRVSDGKSQSSESKNNVQASSKAETAESSQRDSSTKHRIIGAIKKTFSSAGIVKDSHDSSRSTTHSTRNVGSGPTVKTTSDHPHHITDIAPAVKTTFVHQYHTTTTAPVMNGTSIVSERLNDVNKKESERPIEELPIEKVKEQKESGLIIVSSLEETVAVGDANRQPGTLTEAVTDYDSRRQQEILSEAITDYDSWRQQEILSKATNVDNATNAANATVTVKEVDEDNTSLGPHDQKVHSLSIKQGGNKKTTNKAVKQGQKFVTFNQSEPEIKSSITAEIDKENNAQYEAEGNEYGNGAFLEKEEVKVMLASTELSSRPVPSYNAQQTIKKMTQPILHHENGQLKKRKGKQRHVSFGQDVKTQSAHQLDNGINQTTSEQIMQQLQNQNSEISCTHLASTSEQHLHIVEMETDTQVDPPRFSCRRYLCILLPLLGFMFAFLFMALLLPYCEDDWCRWTNTFRRGLEPVVEFVDGPPPV